LQAYDDRKKVSAAITQRWVIRDDNTTRTERGQFEMGGEGRIKREKAAFLIGNTALFVVMRVRR
jgi:hypothetical protein